MIKIKFHTAFVPPVSLTCLFASQCSDGTFASWTVPVLGMTAKVVEDKNGEEEERFDYIVEDHTFGPGHLACLTDVLSQNPELAAEVYPSGDIDIKRNVRLEEEAARKAKIAEAKRRERKAAA